MRRIIKKSIYVSVLLSLFSTIISCEEDFKDIGSSVISNTKFDTSIDTVEITVKNSLVESVLSDNISFDPGQYLLGVHASTAYEKIEASIISQIAISTGLTLIDSDTLAKYETSTTSIVTTIDTVFIKLPYQATLDDNTLIKIDEKPTYEYKINAGMYIINKSVLDYVKPNTYLDMDKLIEKLISNKLKIKIYEFDYNNWKEIGRMKDYIPFLYEN